jgi:hypothetical protein
MMYRLPLSWIVALTVVAQVANSAEEPSPGPTQETTAEALKDGHSKLFSREDGWLDVSEFVDQAYGFIPLVVPVTEPAVGYGAAGGLAFIDKPPGEAAAGYGRPNITVVAGLATENDTWAIAAADLRHWMNDRVQSLVGAIHASVNLDFYGIGDDAQLKDHPLTYNLEPLGGMVQARYRLGQSQVWMGVGYVLATVNVAFATPGAANYLPNIQRESRIGGLLPSVTFDSRDNMFTPTRGTYVDLTVNVFDPVFGSDEAFQRANLTAMYYLPLHSKVTLGLRGIAAFSFGDAPFYLRPYVAMRGAPVMQYQGEEVAQIEAELRWQFWQRFSVVGFAGTGTAWNNFERLDNKRTVNTGGVGFRYEVARKYGLHMGLDMAVSGDETAFYVQFGSAWMRP